MGKHIQDPNPHLVPEGEKLEHRRALIHKNLLVPNLMLGNHLLIPQPLEHRTAVHCSLPFVNSTGATDGLRSTFHCDPKATVRHSPRKPKLTLWGDVEAEKFLYGCPFLFLGPRGKTSTSFLLCPPTVPPGSTGIR